MIVLPIQDMICLGGLPACPGIYQFILPTLLVIGILVKGPHQVRAVEPLGAVWLTAFIVLVVLLETDPLRAGGYIVAALGFGATALVLRR